MSRLVEIGCSVTVLVIISVAFSVLTYFLVDELGKESQPKKPQYLHLERTGGSESCQQKEVVKGGTIACWEETRSSSFADVAVLKSGTQLYFLKSGFFDVTGQVTVLAGIANFGLSVAIDNKTYSMYNGNSEKSIPPGVPAYPYTCTVVCKNIEILKGQVLTLNSLFKGPIHEDPVRNAWDIEVKYLL